MKITQYVDAMKIVSDAVYCAVQDVNRLYGKNLKSRFVSPVTAGSNTNWWAEVREESAYRLSRLAFGQGFDGYILYPFL